MTHFELVKIAYRWVLGSTSCGVAIRELTTMCRNGESPDVIGFMSGASVLVECKVSRSDFLADKKKLFRQHPFLGMGTYRFYCCPEGLIKTQELPDKWGLIYVNDKGKARCVHNPYHKRNDGYNCWENGHTEKCERSERDIMYSALRRLQVNGQIETIYSEAKALTLADG